MSSASRWGNQQSVRKSNNDFDEDHSYGHHGENEKFKITQGKDRGKSLSSFVEGVNKYFWALFKTLIMILYKTSYNLQYNWLTD